jgi:hypothetical protein
MALQDRKGQFSNFIRFGQDKYLIQITCKTDVKNITKYIWYDIWYMIYLLTAIGLTSGGGSTAHIYTQTTQRTECPERNVHNNKNT